MNDREPGYYRNRNAAIVEQRKLGSTYKAIAALWGISGERVTQIVGRGSSHREIPYEKRRQWKKLCEDRKGAGWAVWKLHVAAKELYK